MTIDTVRLTTDSTSVSSVVSLSVADEYDIITGGHDLKEQQVCKHVGLKTCNLISRNKFIWLV